MIRWRALPLTHPNPQGSIRRIEMAQVSIHTLKLNTHPPIHPQINRSPHPHTHTAVLCGAVRCGADGCWFGECIAVVRTTVVATATVAPLSANSLSNTCLIEPSSTTQFCAGGSSDLCACVHQGRRAAREGQPGNVREDVGNREGKEEPI